MTNMATGTGAFSNSITPTFAAFCVLQSRLSGKTQAPKHRQNGNGDQKEGDSFNQHSLHPKTGKGGAFLNSMGDIAHKGHAKSGQQRFLLTQNP